MLFVKSSFILYKMNKLFILFLIALSIESYSQSKELDSIYMNKINFYKNTNNDSTLHFIDKIKHTKYNRYKIMALSVESYIYYRKKDYSKSEEIAKKLLDVVNRFLPNSNQEQFYYDGIISAYNRLFWIEKNKENYNKAYEYLTKIHETNESTPYKGSKYLRHKISIKMMRAIMKKTLKLDVQAKQLLLDAYNESNNVSFEKLKKDEFFLQQRANIINSLGNIYLNIGYQNNNMFYIDSADYYFDKAYKVTQLFNPPHKDSEIIYNFRKTEILIARKEFSKALDLINSYKKISNGYPYLLREYFQKAICFHNLKKSDSAIYYSNKLLKNRKKCETSKLITIYDILSKEYNNLNKLDSAYKYSKLTLDQYNLAKNTKDKTFNLFYNNNFEQAQQLNKTIEKREAKKQRNLIISFIVLLLTFIIITFYILKKEKEKKKKLILIMNENKPIETEKKEYNIDEVLETKILNEFKNTTKNLDFLKPNFSINFIAEKLDTNTTYISFVFNKHHDESFKQYCTRLKINYVVERLKTDKNFRKYSIQAIAEEIGYTNASAFTRAFKKHIGVTPSIFLKGIEN